MNWVQSKVLPSYYVLLWAQSSMDIIKSRANGTTFLEVSKANFRPIEVVVPSEVVLQSFFEVVAPLFQLITRNLEQSRTLTALRDTMLPKLLSGELRVRDAERLWRSSYHPQL